MFKQHNYKATLVISSVWSVLIPVNGEGIKYKSMYLVILQKWLVSRFAFKV